MLWRKVKKYITVELAWIFPPIWFVIHNLTYYKIHYLILGDELHEKATSGEVTIAFDDDLNKYLKEIVESAL